MSVPRPQPLYRRQELAFSTQYAELKERCFNEGELLAGTPGSLSLRTGTGHAYWYRRHYATPGKELEDLVCKDGDAAALLAMRQRIESALWVQEQVRALRRLGFQVAGKDAARVLVELHNQRLFAAGLVVVGTLAYMAWLNDLGAVAVAMRTQDIDLARRQRLALAAPLSFQEAVAATRLDFAPVPGMGSAAPSTSLKRPGREGLRVDMLVPGKTLGQPMLVPELRWHAQMVPHYDYLLNDARRVALLAGGHCVPVNAPAPERLVWHKLYSSASRGGDRVKAEKDLRQAATLAAILVEVDDVVLERSLSEAPSEVRAAARSRMPSLKALLQVHPQALEQMGKALASGRRR
jgi:hypothetical protein